MTPPNVSPGLLCPEPECTHGKNGERYVGKTPKALASHVQKRHAEYLRPLPLAPADAPWEPESREVPRAAIYLRVSTIDQHPENQLPNVRRFCDARGYKVVAQYVDKASGKNTKRPELQQLLMDSVAYPRPFDVLVFRRLSRLGRNLRDNIGIFDHFTKLGIAVWSVEEPYDTTTPSGRLVRNVLGSVHEYQREAMLEELQEGIARRRAEGKYVGRHPMGCGIPVELGGRGPCPDGVQHKGFNGDLVALAARRQKDAARKRRYRQAKRDKGTPESRPLSPVDRAPRTEA